METLQNRIPITDAQYQKYCKKLDTQYQNISNKLKELKEVTDNNKKTEKSVRFRREQLFDMISKLIDKYNEQAKKIIMSIGR